MNAPSDEPHKWRDFAHTVDVLAASALAKSDLAEALERRKAASAPRTGANRTVTSSLASKVVVGAIVAFCLLLVAVPIWRLEEPAGHRSEDSIGAEPGGRLADRPLETIELEISLAKTSYRIGEPLSFTLRTNKDCRLLVFSIGANDEVTLEEPAVSAPSAGEPLLRAGGPRHVAAAPGRANIHAVPGKYTIGALCAGEAFAALGISDALLRGAAQRGGQSFVSHLESLSGRLGGAQLARAMVVYEVN